jgi:hypothetical protein
MNFMPIDFSKCSDEKFKNAGYRDDASSYYKNYCPDLGILSDRY